MCQLTRRPLFNPLGDTDTAARRIINGNTTNLNDFNNMKYAWVSGWYRQAMNNFWIPEEINLAADVKDYPRLSPAERCAFDKILSFLVFLDSIQTANLPSVGEYITANEVNLCLCIQAFQEAVHSQSYSYMLDTRYGKRYNGYICLILLGRMQTSLQETLLQSSQLLQISLHLLYLLILR